MKTLQLLVIPFLGFFKSGHALAYEQSRPTPALNNENAMLNGWTPKPTTPPALHHGLFARQQYDYNTVLTCGFVDSDPNNALYCGESYGCAFWTTTPAIRPQFFGCCPVTGGSTIDFSATNCFYASTCLDYSASGNSQLATQSTDASSKVVHCGSDSQWCAPTYLSSQGGTYTHFDCVTTTSQFTYAYDTSSGAASSPTPTPFPTSTRPLTSLVPDTSTSTSTTTSAAPTPPPGGGGSNTGAIAGGAVGGVVGLAAIGGLIGWLIYRKKKQRAEAVPEVSQYTTYANK